MDENQFASLLGHAALKVWPELPREAQQRLFSAAVDDGIIANSLAEFLHGRHPKTSHPQPFSGRGSAGTKTEAGRLEVTIADYHVKERFTQIWTARRECGPPLRRYAKDVRGSHGMEDAMA